MAVARIGTPMIERRAAPATDLVLLTGARVKAGVFFSCTKLAWRGGAAAVYLWLVDSSSMACGSWSVRSGAVGLPQLEALGCYSCRGCVFLFLSVVEAIGPGSGSRCCSCLVGFVLGSSRAATPVLLLGACFLAFGKVFLFWLP